MADRQEIGGAEVSNFRLSFAYISVKFSSGNAKLGEVVQELEFFLVTTYKVEMCYNC